MPTPLKVVPKPQSEPISPVRQELRRLNAQVKAAQQELERLRAPERRLQAAIGEHEAAVAELSGLRSEDDRILGDWLAGGAQGARPSVSEQTIECEQRVARLARDASAAQQALPAAVEAVQRASEGMGRLHRQRDDALYRAVVEAAETYASGPLLEAHNAALRHDAVLQGLEAELFDIGNRSSGGSPAQQAAIAVAEIRRGARDRAGVPYDRTAARKLLAEITNDPDVELE